ncbi:UPF0057-domain-containing protein [Neocallimastix lanati (nom. inval.)]|uniref:UPF0057-domain-containing protein n=1 Tax=Neocallimastix californiae TaxID=1754190 RepID=A0A1Y2ESZ6_9FUNG|nr:UPF0057-domain-containing protein [Neocallimastix sp. JGI-2020a]ORY74683.1 UPF0057-domain-containing protein [Neocallimastix californiae]|eukprot:ORY74683.1 UPF0057-domain-containing protein [Neocallimastix californiae]
MHFTLKDILLFVIAFFLPPLAVFMKRGLLNDFWINLIFTLIGVVPGIIHGWYICFIYRDENYEAIKNDNQYHPINEE